MHGRAAPLRTFAVLPVKTFPHAKSRTRLDHPRRAALAGAMLDDVLDALAEVTELEGVLVVTREPRAIEAAARVGAAVVHEDREAGHSAAAVRGARAAMERGARRVLLVPSDCPELQPAELSQLLAEDAAGPRAVTVVPDRHGSGTNALLLTPPDVMVPSFGPGSFARHAALARAAGARVRVAALASLAFDVDTPEDLAELRSPGSRTRAFLGAIPA